MWPNLFILTLQSLRHVKTIVRLEGALKQKMAQLTPTSPTNYFDYCLLFLLNEQDIFLVKKKEKRKIDMMNTMVHLSSWNRGAWLVECLSTKRTG